MIYMFSRGWESRPSGCLSTLTAAPLYPSAAGAGACHQGCLSRDDSATSAPRTALIFSRLKKQKVVWRIWSVSRVEAVCNYTQFPSGADIFVFVIPLPGLSSYRLLLSNMSFSAWRGVWRAGHKACPGSVCLSVCRLTHNDKKTGGQGGSGRESGGKRGLLFWLHPETRPRWFSFKTKRPMVYQKRWLQTSACSRTASPKTRWRARGSCWVARQSDDTLGTPAVA